jgi:hypothetical protein
VAAVRPDRVWLAGAASDDADEDHHTVPRPFSYVPCLQTPFAVPHQRRSRLLQSARKLGPADGRGGGIRTHDLFVPKITARVSGVACCLMTLGIAYRHRLAPLRRVATGTPRLTTSRLQSCLQTRPNDCSTKRDWWTERWGRRCCARMEISARVAASSRRRRFGGGKVGCGRARVARKTASRQACSSSPRSSGPC